MEQHPPAWLQWKTVIKDWDCFSYWFLFPSENAAEQEFGTKLNTAAVPCGNESRTPNSSPLKFSERLTHCQTAESTNSAAISWNANNGKSTQGCKQERRAFSSASALHTGVVKENAKSPVVTCRRQMSIVASGLNQSELVSVFHYLCQSPVNIHIPWPLWS